MFPRCASFSLHVFFPPSFLPDVGTSLSGAAAHSARGAARGRRLAAPHLHRRRPGEREAAGVRSLPPRDLPARALHGDAEERVRAVSRGLVHGAVELHREVSPLRGVRTEPGGEDTVHRQQQLSVRVQTGILLQRVVRDVSPTQRVSAGTGSPHSR